ncbi:hypothetical protein OBV_13100 [Oscillibacter valericigenes Sjm18-20]|nr:hypothetical protein OBV_13100 [Oscillibacter valericigenes Sjm18-20]
MIRHGNCYDNAMAENFFAILNTECNCRHKPGTLTEVNERIDRFTHFAIMSASRKTGVAPLTLRHSA